MEERSKNWVVGISLCVAGMSLAGVGVCIFQTREARRMIAGAAEHVRDLSHVDIDQKMVDRLVMSSVKEQAHDAAKTAADRAGKCILADMTNRVKQVVNSKATDINRQVAEKIAEEVSDLKRDDIIEDVVSATTEKLVEKLGDDLDSEVGRIGKIYQGIAEALR